MNLTGASIKKLSQYQVFALAPLRCKLYITLIDFVTFYPETITVQSLLLVPLNYRCRLLATGSLSFPPLVPGIIVSGGTV